MLRCVAHPGCESCKLLADLVSCNATQGDSRHGQGSKCKTPDSDEMGPDAPGMLLCSGSSGSCTSAAGLDGDCTVLGAPMKKNLHGLNVVND